MKCTTCGKIWEPKKTTSRPRMPNGWHRDSNHDPHCRECWERKYVLRAITFRVVGPVDGDWPGLREALKISWATATRVSNWAVRECAKVDVVRTPDMDKIPKMPAIYLYGLARQQRFDMGSDSQSASAILRNAEAKYRAQRYDTIWLGKASTLSFRFPTPYPIHNASWTLSIEQERLVLSVRLGGERRKLILSGGHGFKRQRNSAEQLIAGMALPGEAALYERRSHPGDHRNGVNGKDSGDQKASSMLMAKLVMWLPRQQNGDRRHGTLVVRTDSDALIVALNVKDERLWVYNADHIRRWTAEHRRKLNRWSDDSKAENRPPKFQSRREAAVTKFRHRMDSAVKEIAAQIVGYAVRRRFATIRYTDTDQSYVERFPYYALRQRIAQKADEAYVMMETSEDSGDAEKPGSTRKDGKAKQ